MAIVDPLASDKNGAGPLVCIVDDDVTLLRALGRALRVAGFRIEAFTSAEEFLQARPAGPLCLILDVRLGGMSGFELHDVLVASGTAPPVIFISAHDDFQTREPARRAGAVQHLRKPFEVGALIDAIHRASKT